MLKQLSDIDYLALLERLPLPTPDPDDRLIHIKRTEPSKQIPRAANKYPRTRLRSFYADIFVDLSQFEGREEWLIVAQHRQELVCLGVNLAGRELEEAIEGYPHNVEGAVIAFLERFQKHNKSATRKLALLIRSGVTPVNKDCANTPRLPVRIAFDFTAPLVPPT